MLIRWSPEGAECGTWRQVNGTGVYVPPSRTGNFRARFQDVEILVITQSQLMIRPIPQRTSWMRVPRYYHADTLEVLAMPDQFEPEIEVDASRPPCIPFRLSS